MKTKSAAYTDDENFWQIVSHRIILLFKFYLLILNKLYRILIENGFDQSIYTILLLVIAHEVSYLI